MPINPERLGDGIGSLALLPALEYENRFANVFRVASQETVAVGGSLWSDARGGAQMGAGAWWSELSRPAPRHWFLGEHLSLVTLKSASVPRERRAYCWLKYCAKTWAPCIKGSPIGPRPASGALGSARCAAGLEPASGTAGCSAGLRPSVDGKLTTVAGNWSLV